MDLLRLNNVKFSLHKYANDHCLWTLWILTICCVSFFVLILSIWLTIDKNNLINHILEFSKNLIQTSLILLIHFTMWIKLNVNNKDTTTTPVMLFWCFTCFEYSNFKYILHTLFYCFYFWLWTGSCTFDLRSYSFKIKLISVSFGKTLPYWAGEICQATSLHPYSPNIMDIGVCSYYVQHKVAKG